MSEDLPEADRHSHRRYFRHRECPHSRIILLNSLFHLPYIPNFMSPIQQFSDQWLERKDEADSIFFLGRNDMLVEDHFWIYFLFNH